MFYVFGILGDFTLEAQVYIMETTSTTYLLVEQVRGFAGSKLGFPLDSLMELNSDGTT